MSEGKRPGGLTAMAIINFIFAGMTVLGIFVLVALAVLFSSGIEINDPEVLQLKEDWEKADLGLGFLIFVCILNVVIIILLLLSGIGYLKQKRFLGKVLGNTFALILVGYTVMSAIVLPPSVGGGINVGTIFNLLYPILTLIFLNTTFKEDFIN